MAKRERESNVLVHGLKKNTELGLQLKFSNLTLASATIAQRLFGQRQDGWSVDLDFNSVRV